MIIHGDIKPHNVLVCEGNGGEFVAKIADFGSSRTGRTEGDSHHLHHSEIWSPPEYHHRKFSISAAKKMDAYSFALLCLWLLLDESHGAVDAESATKVLQEMKQKGDLTGEAQVVVFSLSLETASKDRLASLLKTTLEEDPAKRALDVQALAQLLSPNQYGPDLYMLLTFTYKIRDIDSMIYGGLPVLQETIHINFKVRQQSI